MKIINLQYLASNLLDASQRVKVPTGLRISVDAPQWQEAW